MNLFSLPSSYNILKNNDISIYMRADKTGAQFSVFPELDQ